MPHDAHFLQRLDRVTREKAEFALSFYRDHEAVAWILDRLQLPEDAKRVAFAIDDAQGPHVVVTRDGHFVTCLGAGMSTGTWPVVPRARTDALRAKLAEQRRRLEVAERERRHGEDDDLDVLMRVMRRGERMSREDFVAASAFLPIFGGGLMQILLENLRELVDLRAVLVRESVFGPDAYDGLKAYHNLEWSIAHLMLLWGMRERDDTEPFARELAGKKRPASILCTLQMGLTFALRGAWAAARVGRGLLAGYKQTLASAERGLDMLDCVLAIGAIALRHSSAAAEARKLLAAQAAVDEASPDTTVAKPRAAYVKYMLDVLDDPEDTARRALNVGRTVVFGRAESLDDDALRFEREEDVPDDLARTTVLSIDASLTEQSVLGLAMASLTLAARAAPEDFYWPRALLRPMLGDYDTQDTVDRLARYASMYKVEQVRAGKRVGRNEPCPCGSGRKFKKCCG